MRILLLDNYDSFTYNLRHYIEIGGAECFVLRNDEESLKQLQPDDFDGVVISPGPQTPAESAFLPDFIKIWIHAKPTLGICLGHQALGVAFGATLTAARQPVHGKVKKVKHLEHLMFEGIPGEFEACRYHSLILTHIPEEFPFEITAWSEEEIMAMAHKNLPVWGVQYHPEAILSQYGQKLINNWLELVRNSQHNLSL